MTTAFALLAGASLSFLPLGLFVVRSVMERIDEPVMPPMPRGSLERAAAETPDRGVPMVRLRRSPR